MSHQRRLAPHRRSGAQPAAAHQCRRQHHGAVQLPGFIPGAAQINASQRLFAESIYAADQHTWALATSWNTPWGGLLKLE
jgi:hypothetical protein